MSDLVLQGLDQLKVSPAVRERLRDFIAQLVRFYQHDLVTITAFGSAVSGDYSESTSDLNLLIVYSDLNLADLNEVAKLAQTWLKKARFVPRFLSRRNLTESARYFQIDYLEMRDAHVTLYGEDVLAGFEVRRADLHWQLAHEIKRIRMRLKQQFWRAAGDRDLMRLILVRRFTSLIHLIRALLFLQHGAAPIGFGEILQRGVAEFGIDAAFADQMIALKTGRLKLNKEELTAAFTSLMDAVRAVDQHVDRLEV